MSQVYYPSLVCHFRVRFDEAFTVAEPLPAVTPNNELARLPHRDDARSGPRPLIVDQGTRDNLSHVLNRVPKDASVELTGFRQASKFSITMDWREMPLDPRLIRSMAVEIHLGAVPAGDFAQGINGVDADTGRRASILDTRSPDGETAASTLLMVGLVDGMTVEQGDGTSELQLEGRDLSGIFLDSPVNTALMETLDLSRPIDDVVRQILERHPFGGRVNVETNPFEWPNATLPSPGTRDGLTRVRRNADGQGQRSTPQGGSDSLSFWDLITRYCFLVGAAPFFAGYALRIRPARSLYDINRNPSAPTPFSGGSPRTVDGEQLRIRRLVYGRNVRSLRIERKYTGQTGRVVEVVSVDTSRRGDARVLTARWPETETEARQSLRGRAGAGNLTTPGVAGGASSAAVRRAAPRRTAVSPHGQESHEEVLRITVPGISNQQQLKEIARNTFEEIARGELGGSVETSSLASFGGGNDDPDLLKLRPGDAIELVADVRQLRSAHPLVSEYTDHHRRSFDEQVQEIAQRIGDENLARVIVATGRNSVAELQRFFRVGNVKYTWGADKGIAVSFDFQNYIEARLGTSPTQGAGQPSVSVQRATARPGQTRPRVPTGVGVR